MDTLPKLRSFMDFRASHSLTLIGPRRSWGHFRQSRTPRCAEGAHERRIAFISKADPFTTLGSTRILYSWGHGEFRGVSRRRRLEVESTRPFARLWTPSDIVGCGVGGKETTGQPTDWFKWAKGVDHEGRAPKQEGRNVVMKWG